MDGLTPTSGGEEAVALWRAGVACLLRGQVACGRAWLDRAVAADATLAVAHGSLALAAALDGDRAAAAGHAAVARAAAVGAHRWERQHVQIVALVIAGDRCRAEGLADEHLVDYPDDDVVRLAVSTP